MTDTRESDLIHYQTATTADKVRFLKKKGDSSFDSADILISDFISSLGLLTAANFKVPAGETIINSMSDFPAPNGSGEIELDANGSTTYVCSGNLVTTAKFKCTTPGLTIRFEFPSQGRDTLATTNADEMFLFENCNLLVWRGNLFATSATNGVFNCKNTAGFEKTSSVQLINTFVNGSSGGKFTDLATFSSFIPGFQGNCPFGYQFFGGFIRCAIQNMQFENITGIALDLGTSTFDSFKVNDGTYNPTATNTFLSGLANSGNINVGGSGIVLSMGFEGTDAPTVVNIEPSDKRWNFQDNGAIPDSGEGGACYLDPASTAATSLTVADQYERIAGTTAAGTSNSRINQTANNELEWDSLRVRNVAISAFGSATKSGSTENYHVTIRKQTGGSGAFVPIDANAIDLMEIKNVPSQFFVEVEDIASEGDKYEVAIKGIGHTDNPTAVSMGMVIK